MSFLQDEFVSHSLLFILIPFLGISDHKEISSLPEYHSSGVTMATGTAIHYLQYSADERPGQGECPALTLKLE